MSNSYCWHFKLCIANKKIISPQVINCKTCAFWTLNLIPIKLSYHLNLTCNSTLSLKITSRIHIIRLSFICYLSILLLLSNYKKDNFILYRYLLYQPRCNSSQSLINIFFQIFLWYLSIQQLILNGMLTSMAQRC